MSTFEYRVFVAPSIAKKVKGAKTLAERFAHSLAEVLNVEAREGWDFVGREQFQVEGKTGLLGKSRTSEETYLIFRRAKAASTKVPLEERLETMVEMRERNKSAVVTPDVTAKPVEPVKTAEETAVSAAVAEFMFDQDENLERSVSDKPRSGASEPLSSRSSDDNAGNAPSLGPAGRK